MYLSKPWQPGYLAEESGSDLTPLIDLLFVVLVFFLLTTGSAAVRQLDVQLPRSADASHAPAEDEPLRLSIDTDGYRLGETTVTDLDDLERQLRLAMQQRPQTRIVIAGDRRVALEKFVDALAVLERLSVPVAHVLMSEKTNP